MNPQTPAEGIMAFKAYPDMKFFRVPCECSCDNEIDVMVESDEGQITVSFDTKAKSHYWNEFTKITYDEAWIVLSAKSLINAIAHRASVMWEVLTKGYVTSSVHVLLTKQQALNFSNVLIDSIEACETQRQQIKDKQNAKV